MYGRVCYILSDVPAYGQACDIHSQMLSSRSGVWQTFSDVLVYGKACDIWSDVLVYDHGLTYILKCPHAGQACDIHFQMSPFMARLVTYGQMSSGMIRIGQIFSNIHV